MEVCALTEDSLTNSQAVLKLNKCHRHSFIIPLAHELPGRTPTNEFRESAALESNTLLGWPDGYCGSRSRDRRGNTTRFTRTTGADCHPGHVRRRRRDIDHPRHCARVRPNTWENRIDSPRRQRSYCAQRALVGDGAHASCRRRAGFGG
jgi:hypothetical protein